MGGKYASRGLVVVGVQTPEFDFEGDLGNVRRAIRERHVRYPVAVDNDYAVWRAFDNHYWPALCVQLLSEELGTAFRSLR